MNKLLITLVCCLGGLASCEVSQNYAYRVANNAAGEISVHVEAFAVDTTIIIQPGQVSTVLVQTHFSTITEKTKHSVAIDLFRCDIAKDGQPSSKDYLKNESWTYRDGVYSAAVSDAEFPAMN